MAATATARDTRRILQRHFWEAPLWLGTLAGFTLSAALWGYRPVGHIGAVIQMFNDPWDIAVTPDNTYLHQSPLGPILGWAFGISSREGIAAFSLGCTIVCMAGAAYVVRSYVNDFAARLLLIAYFCSPLAALAVHHLGMFDTFTIAGTTVMMVAGGPWCFAAGMVMGFNHFEQSLIAFVGCCLLRGFIRRDTPRVLLYGFIGLLAGKLMLYGYLNAADITITNTRSEIARNSIDDSYRLWRGRITEVVFSVYNVLWLPILVMARRLPRDHLCVLAGFHLAATVPVMVALDLTRVYAIVTWPIVVFTALYWAERDTPEIRRGAAWLLVAAVFVPRVVINYLGETLVSRWDRPI